MKIVEAGSFSRAAATIYIAQPALSSQIAELEAELGVPLLHRNPRGVRPTTAGEAFYREAIDILRRVDRLPELVRDTGGDIAGSVSLGMSSTLASIFAGPVMKHCRESLPGVNLSFVTDDSVTLRGRLDAHTLDLAVLFENEPLPGLVRTPLLQQDYFLVEGTGRKRTSRTVTLADIAALPLILPSQPNGARVLLDRVFAQAGVVPNIVAETNVFASVVSAVQAGLGATLLPIGDFTGQFGAEGLVATPIDAPVFQTASLVYSDSASLGRAAEALHKLLAKYIPHFIEERQPPGMRPLGA